jgi:hypothetical protein
MPTGARQELFDSRNRLGWPSSDKQYVRVAEAGDSVRILTFKVISNFSINPASPDWESVMASVRSLLGIQ